MIPQLREALVRAASCPRCNGEIDGRARWCADCERAFDLWVRRHASDIVWPVLSGTVMVTALALGLPLLGLGSLIAATAIFAGFGTIGGLYRLNRRRRRRQFLREGEMPRAYLPSKT